MKITNFTFRFVTLSCLLCCLGWVSLSAQDIGVTITFNAGFFAGEPGFEFINTANNQVLYCEQSGGMAPVSPVVQAMPQGATIQVRGFDSFGDSWNGGSINASVGSIDLFNSNGPPNAGFSPSGNSCNGLPSSVAAAGAAILGSFVVPAPPCVITCPADVVASNDPGVCGAFVNIPQPTINEDCGGVTILASSGQVDVNPSSNGGNLEIGEITTVTIPLNPLPAPTNGDVTLTMRVNADNSFTGERWNVILEGTNLGLTGNFGDCPGSGFNVYTFNIPAALFQSASADGQLDIDMSAAGTAINPNLCGDDFFEGLVEYSPVGAPAFINDYNGTDDATDNYPVGTTVVTFITTDLATGIPISCQFNVTVVDDELPVFLNCPNDLTINLDPGLCEIQYEFGELEVSDNCPINFSVTGFGQFPDFEACPGQGVALACGIGRIGIIQELDLTPLPAGATIDELCFVWDQAAWGQALGEVNLYVGPPALHVTDDAPPSYLQGSTPISTAGGGGILTLANFGAPGTAICIPLDNPVLYDPATIPGLYMEVINAGAGGSPVHTPFDCNGDPATGEFTYFATEQCNPMESYIDDIGFAVDALYGYRALVDTKAEADPNNQFASGDFLPRGVNCFRFTITDLAGNVGECEWCVTVKEFPNQRNQVNCNDLVNITLSADDCSAVIGADDVLEGGPYGCYDDYIVMVSTEKDGAPIPGSPEVTGEYVGQTLWVKVTDPDNNSTCWGRLLIEDKNIPDLECATYTVSCETDITPIIKGSVSQTRSASIVDPANIISGVAPNVFELPLQFPGSVTNVTDVNLEISINHTFIDDLEVSVTSPDGTELLAWSNIGGFCAGGGGVNVTIDDQAPNTNNDLIIQCPMSPDFVTGSYQPAELFSGFNGENATGSWLVTVTDLTAGADDGSVNFVTLTVSAATQGGIPLPIPGGGSSGTVRIGTDVFGNPIYRVSNFDPCGDVTISIMETNETFECEDIRNVVTRMYTVVDESGNTTNCSDIINRLAGTGAAITFPDDVTVSCTNPNTDPTRTGRPNVAQGVCGIGFIVFDPVDLTTDDGCGTKILRRWRVKDECTGDIFEDEQWIAIRDVTAPVIPNCPDTLVKLTQLGVDCTAKIRVSELLNIIRTELGAFDQCDPILDYSFLLDGKVYTSAQGGTFVFFAPGFTDITIFVTNDCGLTSECETQIFVKDAPPVANCDQETTVGLGDAIDYDWDNNPNTDNIANGRVCADRVDDGSYDNCGSIVSYEVRRVDGRLGSRFGRYLDCVYFDCEDIGTEVMVELRVTNEEGETNTCMASVEVFDKLAPTFHPCPGNQEVACENYDDEDYSFLPFISTTDNGGAFPPVLLVVQTENGAFDTIPTGFYNGLIHENCGVDRIILNRFGQLECDNGTLNIELVAVDFSGNEGRCFFSLKVNPTTFNICDTECRTAPITFGCPTAHTLSDNVEWPCDIEINSCGMGLTPDELEDQAADIGINPLDARPQIFGESCSEVSVGYQDFLLSNIDPNECVVRKIQRTWKITDWCQEDNTTASGAKEWTYQQIIKVLKTSAPTFDACEDVTVTVEDDDDDCAVTGAIEVNASDDCVPSNELEYSYIFDVGNDGSIDFNSELTGGLFPGDDPSTPNIIEGTFPVDVHFIEFTVRDVCGNEEVCGFLVTVEDNKQPSPVCVGLFTPVMPSTGEITLDASIFDKESFDNCTSNENLVFAYSRNAGDTERTFDCDDAAGPAFDIEICVRDEAGNWDCCMTQLDIQDPEDVCDNNPTSSIVSGAIATEFANPVAKVDVSANSNNGGNPKVMTTTNSGTYQFNLNNGYNYTVEPTKDIDYKNGVSTFDLVLIAQHVLKTNLFTSPYQIIAADANNDKKVTTFDILELRKIVLELTNDLPNNTSWRFVDASYVFPNSANPFVPAFPEVIDFNNLSADELNNNFVAVKIGDVSGDVTTTYTANNLVFSTADMALKAGESYTVDFNANDFTDVFGYQFTLNFDPAVMNFTDVQAGELKGLDANSFGLTGVNEGRILTSWNADAVSLQNGTNVFSLTFTALKDAQLSSVLSLTSNSLRSEAYAKAGISEVSLRFEGAEAQNGVFALYQNEPNPFKSQTLIGFNLPEAGNATLTIYDVSGKVLFSADKQYQQGYNMETITRSELGAASGVLYYKLETADNTATKKMIIID